MLQQIGMDRKRFDAQQRNVHRLQPVIETLDLLLDLLSASSSSSSSSNCI